MDDGGVMKPAKCMASNITQNILTCSRSVTSLGTADIEGMTVDGSLILTGLVGGVGE